MTSVQYPMDEVVTRIVEHTGNYKRAMFHEN